jgi:hypothetical protein
MSEKKPFLSKIGGRKQANGYVYALLATAMALKLDATFDLYAMWLAAALLGTSTIVAIEDMKKNGRPQ